MTKSFSDKQPYCLTAFIADVLTLMRSGVAVLIVILGWYYGKVSLPSVLIIVTAGWMTDALDGYFARHSSCPTRLAFMDFPMDVILTWGALFFLAAAGFISWWFAIGYTLVAAFFTFWFRQKPVLVLFMRIIDMIAIYFALKYACLYTLPLLIWLLILAWVHRQRLRNDVPAWLKDLKNLRKNKPSRR